MNEDRVVSPASESLTIVICTFNRANDLRVTLDALVELDWYEVIVVDNASTDGTADLLEDYRWVSVIRNRTNIGVPGFATGVAAASTPYVMLLDDDAIPDPDVGARLVERFDRDPRLAAIACHIETPDGTVVTHNWPSYPVLFWGCGAGIRVQSIERVGPMFYPRLRLHGTELDLCVRFYSAGLHVEYDAGSRVTHRFSDTNRSRSRRMRTVTYASVRFAWDHLSRSAALLATYRTLANRRIDSLASLRGCLLGLMDLVADVGDIRVRRRVVPKHVEDAYLSAVWEYQPRRTPREPVGFPAHHVGG